MAVSLTDPWPSIRQALVRSLRANLVLKAELPSDGDWSEGSLPQGSTLPRGVYSLAFLPPTYDTSGPVWIAGVDVVIFSEDQGDAARLAALVFGTLQDAKLDPTGLTSIICRRIGTISIADPDEQGAKTFTEGATYEIRASDVNPTNRTLPLTLDMTVG
jgi:hypothetical protein